MSLVRVNRYCPRGGGKKALKVKKKKPAVKQEWDVSSCGGLANSSFTLEDRHDGTALVTQGVVLNRAQSAINKVDWISGRVISLVLGKRADFFGELLRISA